MIVHHHALVIARLDAQSFRVVLVNISFQSSGVQKEWNPAMFIQVQQNNWRGIDEGDFEGFSCVDIFD